MGKEENAEKMCEGCLTEEELIKWKRGVTLLDAEFEKVDSWEEAWYGLDSEDDIMYTIDSDRIMEPVLSFEDVLKLAEMVTEIIKGKKKNEEILLPKR